MVKPALIPVTTMWMILKYIECIAYVHRVLCLSRGELLVAMYEPWVPQVDRPGAEEEDPAHLHGVVVVRGAHQALCISTCKSRGSVSHVVQSRRTLVEARGTL